MPSFNVTDLIGKTLHAKTSVPIKRWPEDDSPIIRTVPAGATVGVIYSWLNVKPGRSRLHFQFMDQEGRSYYVEFISGRFNLTALRSQGVQSIEEQNEANKPFLERTVGKLVAGGLGLGAIYVIGRLFQRR
ncbi:MAG: hypothetical protein AAFQ37_03495 [Bacteroidota bacterium]